MSLMDFFKSPTPQAPVATNDTSPQGPTPTKPEPQVSEVDSFSDLWNTGATETPEDDTDISSVFNLDPDKIKESVSKINFTDSLSPETLEAISSGGDVAVKAFSSSLNLVAQEVFSKAMLANGVLVKQALSKAQGKMDARTSKHITRQKVSEELTSTNPLLKDPAIAPMVAAVQEQLQRKYPDAGPSEIRTQTEKYFNAFAEKVRGPKKKESDEIDFTDFSNFFN